MSSTDGPTESFDRSAGDRRTHSVPGSVAGLPVEQQQQLDAVCDRFEAGWRGRGRPDIAAALPELPEPLRPVALRELVALDVFYRRKAGEGPRAEDYTIRFPDLDPDWLAAVLGDADPHAATHAPGAATGPHVAGRVGEFELLGELGRGGMGVVYRARQTGLNREVALKMLLAGGFAGSTLRARFMVEAESVAALEHRNVVRVFAFGEHDGHPYLAMEYLPGGTLADRLKASGPLPGPEAAGLVAKLAGATAHAHSKGVVHRDIKPGNVLFGSDGEPRLADFGLAKVGRLDRDLSATGQVLGTPAYMAPEQAAGKVREVGTAADVYALGAVLYDLLTGRPPFRGDSHAVTLQKVIAEEPARPRALNPRVPRDLETVCLKCLEKDPQKRYPTAQALADELGRYLRGEPVEARPTGRLERAAKWVRRNKAAAALTALTVLLLLSAVGGGVALAYSRTLEGKNRDLETAKGEAEGRRVEAEEQRGEADRQRARAEREEAESWRRLYFARMSQANVAFQAGNTERVIELLTPYREPTPGKPDPRGFEWHYLWRAARGDLFTVRAHPGGINAVAYSDDGTVIATGGADGTVHLWDAATGAAGKVFDAGPCRITGVGFVPGTPWLAASLSKEAGGEVRVWDTITLQAVRELKLPGRANGLALHPDGKHVAVACDDGLVQVTNLETGAAREWQNMGAANCVAFSPDGKRFAAGGHVGGANRDVSVGWGCLWTWPDGRELTQEIWPFFNADSPVVDLAFRPDSEALLWTARGHHGVAYWNNHLRLSDLRPVPQRKSRYLWGMRDGGDHFTQARFLDGNRAALVSVEGRVKVFDLRKRRNEAGVLVSHHAGHTGPVVAVAVSPGGQFIATAGVTRGAEPVGELRVWHVGPFGPPVTVQGADGHDPFALSPDGRWMAYQNDQTIRICSLDTGAEHARFPLWKDGCCCAQPLFSPDGRWLAVTLSHGGGAVVWRTDTWAEHSRLPLNSGYRVGGAFSADGKLLAMTDHWGVVHIHDIQSHRTLRRWPEDMVNDTIYGATTSFSPSGDRVAASLCDGSVRVWRVAMGNAVPVADLNVETSGGFGPNGAAGRGMELVFAPGFDAVVARFSPDGRRILVGGTAGQVVLHDAVDGRRLVTYRAEGEDEGWVQSCEYTPDGQRILTTSGSGTVRLLDAVSGQELLTLRPFSDDPGQRLATRVSMTPNGRRLVTMRNGLIRVIDVPSPSPLPNLDPGELVRVRFAELRLREDVLARVKTEPGLAPNVRASAVRFAEQHPENPDSLRDAMWRSTEPSMPVEKPEAERQVRLADAYLKHRPGDPSAQLNRGAALFHLGRDAEAEVALARFQFGAEKGQVGSPQQEGARLAFLALARVRLNRFDAARQSLRELEQLIAVTSKGVPVGEPNGLLTLVSLVRARVPPPVIPKADE